MKYEPVGAPQRAQSCDLAELVGAFSYALDITEGQPAGHCVRSCWIGSHIGIALGLDAAARTDLYYTLLLKDLGCSSNAARICELYDADDRAFKQGYKTVGTGLAATILFVARKTATVRPLRQRLAAIGNILGNGDGIAQELILSRCTRGADIARTLRFSERVAESIYRLDEHWDGSGRPDRLRGDAIPLFAQIALLSQVADVFHSHAGVAAATDEVRRRYGTWFDPKLVDAFCGIAQDSSFWSALKAPDLDRRLPALLPTSERIDVDDDYLDAIAAAFGQVIDAKSPYTAGHSTRVAELALAIGEAMDVPVSRRRWLYRAALLHDIGKLGVSNTILDKPGSLDDREWESMRSHAAHTQEILGRVSVLADIAPVAAAHHERLDGTGYPLALMDQQIGRETRIITICDFYDALTSDRPYRAAMGNDRALAIIEESVGTAIDPECFAALQRVANAFQPGRL
jgi:HD-GYP domain-containing protein (c-di-GMP phosphodiesterase class II)